MPRSRRCLLMPISLIGSFAISNSAQATHAVSTNSPIHETKDAGDTCSGLESQYGRLMNLPAHLQPEALKAEATTWNEDQEVWLCPDQSSPGDRQRVDYYTGMDCEEMELLFSLYRADEMRSHPQDSFGFDYQSWCKCPGATLQQEQSCELCSSGKGIKKDRLNDMFRVSRGEKSLLVSCSQAMAYAMHITNEDRCLDGLKEARLLCCESLSSATTEEHVISFHDFQMVLLCISGIAGLSSLIVWGMLYILEKIDQYWFSWEDL